MFMFLDRDVMECEHCGHAFRDTAAERGWRVEGGRLLCKRCPSAGNSVSVAVVLLIIALGVVALLRWASQ